MLDELLQLLQTLAPDAGGAVAIAAVVIYVVRTARAELREQRNSRAATSTIGGRVGALDRDLTRLEDALAAQGIYVPGVSPAVRRDPIDQVDDVDRDELDEPRTAQRIAVPPLPPPAAGSYARHARGSEQPA